MAIEKKFIEFIRGIAKSDRVAVVHHTDPDGVSSGVIAAKTVERVREKKIDLRWNQRSGDIQINDDTIKTLKKHKINKVIITDLGVDQDPSTLKKVAEFADVLILDHHKIYNDVNKGNILMIKSQHVSEEIEPASYCASKLCYDLGSSVCDLDDLDWVSCIGIIGDCAYPQWKPFVDKVLKKYGIRNEKEIFDTKLGEVASLLSESESYAQENVEKCFQVLYDAKGYKDVLSSSLKRFHEKVKKEVDKWKRLVKEKAEYYDGLIIFMVDSKYHIKSSLSTHLSFKFPHKTVIVMQPTDGMVSVSARRQDREMPMNTLLEQAIVGLEGANAGGHVPAAGGKVRQEDLFLFKKNILKLTENLK